jgi:enolase
LRGQARARRSGLRRTVGDGGGFAAGFESFEAGLDLLVEAIAASGHRPGDEVVLARNHPRRSVEIRFSG